MLNQWLLTKRVERVRWIAKGILNELPGSELHSFEPQATTLDLTQGKLAETKAYLAQFSISGMYRAELRIPGMSEPHKHHFIPKFYQRGFVPGRGPKIWVYEKDGTPRQRSVRHVGMQIDLYAFERAGKVDFGTVEKELALLDDQASKVIHKLESERSITDKDRARLCRFVSVMWRRTPKHMEYVNKTVVDLVPGVFAPLEQLEDQMSPEVKAEVQRLKEKYSKQPPDFVFAHNVQRDSVFEEVMYSMDWVFFRPPDGREFFTSDDPVMFSKASGLGSSEAIVAFPLSQSLFLQCMRNSTWGNRFAELETSQVDYFNLCTVQNACKQVLASRKSEDISLIVKQNLGSWNQK